MKKASAPSILVAMMLLAIGVAAQAQQPKKVHRIGYLAGGDLARASTGSEAQRLRRSSPNLKNARQGIIMISPDSSPAGVRRVFLGN
jgi:hypothetical protein